MELIVYLDADQLDILLWITNSNTELHGNLDYVEPFNYRIVTTS